MRRVYLLISIASIIASFFLGWKLGAPKIDPAKERALRKQLDSLGKAMDRSVLRERQFKDLSVQYLGQNLELTRRIEERNREKIKIVKIYEKRIKDIERYTASQLDSFFIKRYPSPDTRLDTAFSSMESTHDGIRAESVRPFEVRIQNPLEGQRGSQADDAKYNGSPVSEGWADQGAPGPGSDSGSAITGSDGIQTNSPEVQASTEWPDDIAGGSNSWSGIPGIQGLEIDH